MSTLKKLASQTIWYGLSSIVARFIGYLQTPIITHLLPDSRGQQAYGDFSVLYAGISIANILFTYGMETAYFRYASKKDTDPTTLFNTAFGTIIISTTLLSILFILLRVPIASFINQEQHPEYVVWAVLIIAFDTLSALPFARLRQEGKPKKYAFIRVSGIVINLILTVVLLYGVQQQVIHHPMSQLSLWYQSHSQGGLLLLPNIAQSAITFLLLFSQWKGFRWQISKTLQKQLWQYGSPMIIIGLGGMVNETIDRIMLLRLFDGTEEQAKIAVAIYSANYKIAIFITLFVQAFKMGAEPFFFKQASSKDAPVTYAYVMKYFVITLCIAFLFSTLFIDVWKHMNPQTYWEGLVVVPILLLANICLGVYYNLLVAFKITDNMKKATLITVIGAGITLLINIAFIPKYGMLACAWATLICYFVMMLLGYFYGQKIFKIPYPIQSISMYFGVAIIDFSIFFVLKKYLELSDVSLLFIGFLLFLLYLLFVYKKVNLNLLKKQGVKS
jgi:O-antigen/teichoic acid export membrane protein